MLDLVAKQLLKNANGNPGEFSCCIENTTGNILVVDVRCSGTCQLQVWALEYGGKDYHQIAVTDLGNLQQLTNITSAGIYTASAVGIERAIIKPINISGSVNVIAKFGTNDANDGGNY